MPSVDDTVTLCVAVSVSVGLLLDSDPDAVKDVVGQYAVEAAGAAVDRYRKDAGLDGR